MANDNNNNNAALLLVLLAAGGGAYYVYSQRQKMLMSAANMKRAQQLMAENPGMSYRDALDQAMVLGCTGGGIAMGVPPYIGGPICSVTQPIVTKVGIWAGKKGWKGTKWIGKEAIADPAKATWGGVKSAGSFVKGGFKKLNPF